jgi:hypothetical protein
MSTPHEGGQNGFFKTLWGDDLREFFLHLLGDAIKTIGILLFLLLFWEVIRLLKLRGYPQEYTDVLEKVHFPFMLISLAMLGTNFATKQARALWRTKH